ncbi:MAG: hypothetical protein F6K10_15220 [Moorea sp. SIO2B7]|nr:hypothetical protein [Moorena sp. SIO2B7]
MLSFRRGDRFDESSQKERSPNKLFIAVHTPVFTNSGEEELLKSLFAKTLPVACCLRKAL